MTIELYAQHRVKMQTGDCLLWRSSSVLGWAIRLFSWAKVNHAGLVVRPNEWGLFKDRRFTLEALEGGIVLRLLSERLRDFNGKVWLYPLKDEFAVLRDEICRWALAQEGTPYDYGSLFKQVFGRVSVEMTRYFCSEFCYAAWLKAGLPVNEPKAPRPGDIPKLGIFKEPVLIFDD